MFRALTKHPHLIPVVRVLSFQMSGPCQVRRRTVLLLLKVYSAL